MKTRNPYIFGGEKASAWEAGYKAALQDAAGIKDEPKRPFVPGDKWVRGA